MRFALACSGTRGDCEPLVAIGLELQQRGHDVWIALPPNLTGFAESVGLASTSYGPDASEMWDAELLEKCSPEIWRGLLRGRSPVKVLRQLWDPVLQHWAGMGKTLASVADGADVLCAGLVFQDVAANVAEHYDIPLAALHYFPVRPNGRLVGMLPAGMACAAMKTYDWFGWHMHREVEEEQRRELGLPKATKPAAGRIADRKALEIQTYDQVCFPGLAAEWSTWREHRPFVGALTMHQPTDADEEVVSWIAAGSPPICFGFGSMPVPSPAGTVEMIGQACAELGQRALICSGWTDYGDVPTNDHVKVVRAVNYEKVFPLCRAVVHHGGSGTTAAGLRAGVPGLILWTAGDQPFWGRQLERLNVGATRSFKSSSKATLATDLRRILAPERATAARRLATQMTPSAVSVNRAVDLLEEFGYRRAG
ncbi:glycosyl transferase family 1 [Mycobacterium sp. NS-7484]|uniref:glycosyltransferase n=1 Tax=Mycobacterium sp. NS-7484 TaxID=1834161 RepID=UPI00096E19ED|nr:glycosyltransferase [Mycobacterium sp. NS-7484]OMB93523.1 glycosyl transferase family 1 [Mycobacterium sp. NS-7484]